MLKSSSVGKGGTAADYAVSRWGISFANNLVRVTDPPSQWEPSLSGRSRRPTPLFTILVDAQFC